MLNITLTKISLEFLLVSGVQNFKRTHMARKGKFWKKKRMKTYSIVKRIIKLQQIKLFVVDTGMDRLGSRIRPKYTDLVCKVAFYISKATC